MPKRKRANISKINRKTRIQKFIRRGKPICSNHLSSYVVGENYSKNGRVGDLKKMCMYCGSKLFVGESGNICCNFGKFELERYPVPPPVLLDLLENTSKYSPHFFNNIRNYNNAFSMTSLGCQEEFCNNLTFKISGRICHRIGSMFSESNDPRFLQLYFLNNAELEVNKRRENTSSILKEDLMKILQEMLHLENKYVREFKCASEIICQSTYPEIRVIVKDTRIPNTHKGRTNLPTADDEVAVVICSDQFSKRDIVLERKCKKVIFEPLFNNYLICYRFIVSL